MKLGQIQMERIVLVENDIKIQGGLKRGTPYRQPKVRCYPKWGTP